MRERAVVCAAPTPGEREFQVRASFRPGRQLLTIERHLREIRIAPTLTASALRRTSRTELGLRVSILAYVLLLIGAPLVGIVQHGFSSGAAAFWSSATAPIARHALFLTLRCAAEISAVNALMGTVVAWVLARYPLPGKGMINALVDLPFALPTLVAGVMLSSLFGAHSLLGETTQSLGVRVIFGETGILLALLLVTLPLVVRSVEPVILGLDSAEEEAAFTLGANRILIFFWVTLRSLAPAITYGSIQCFTRAIAEFGAVVVISGNIPFKTLTSPVFVLGEVESGRTESAATVSVVLLVAAVILSYLTRAVQRRIFSAEA